MQRWIIIPPSEWNYSWKDKLIKTLLSQCVWEHKQNNLWWRNYLFNSKERKFYVAEYFILFCTCIKMQSISTNNAHLGASNIQLCSWTSFLKKGVWWFEITKERHSRKRRLLFVMNQYSSKDYGYMMKKD